MPGFAAAGVVVTAAPGAAAGEQPVTSVEPDAAPLIVVTRGLPLFTVSEAVREAAAAAQVRAARGSPAPLCGLSRVTYRVAARALLQRCDAACYGASACACAAITLARTL
jgi:hypothetical protein